MPTVRVTLFEDPIDVPEDEVAVLRSQGLLVEEAPPAPPAAEPEAPTEPAAPAATRKASS
jgi:hypothetical protein